MRSAFHSTTSVGSEKGKNASVPVLLNLTNFFLTSVKSFCLMIYTIEFGKLPGSLYFAPIF